MSIPASLFNQPTHCIAQKPRKVPVQGLVRLSSCQHRLKPCGAAAQKAGMRYENRVGKKLRKYTMPLGAVLHEHVWISVANRNYQPDYFMVFPSGSVLLFEVKQTWVDTTNQLALYKELLIQLGYISVTCCTICKNLTPETPRERLVRSFSDITEDSIWQVRV